MMRTIQSIFSYRNKLFFVYFIKRRNIYTGQYRILEA